MRNRPCSSAIFSATALGSVVRPGNVSRCPGRPTRDTACGLRLRAPATSRRATNRRAARRSRRRITEHQHQRRHVSGRGEVQTGEARPAFQGGDVITTGLPRRGVDELRRRVTPHVEDEIPEAHFGGGHALRLQCQTLYVLKRPKSRQAPDWLAPRRQLPRISGLGRAVQGQMKRRIYDFAALNAKPVVDKLSTAEPRRAMLAC